VEIELDDLGRAGAHEEELADVGPAGKEARDLAVEFLVRVGEAGEVLLLEDRGAESGFGEDHDARLPTGGDARRCASPPRGRRRPASCGAAR
jgi:hypothetical protein